MRGTILNIAWLASALGIAVEIILIAIHSFFKTVPGVNALAADLVGKMSWSVIVCVGLAFGKAASKNQAATTGLASPAPCRKVSATRSGSPPAPRSSRCSRIYAAATPPPHVLVTQGVNELLFPVGCSPAIFAAETLGKKD